MPLSGGSAGTRVGVLEVYLPYEPIRADIASGLQTLYRDLAVGLLVLYLVLAGISLATTRRLQQQARRNAYLAEHDQLTGLPNRSQFLARIADLADAPAGSRGAVAVLDLDRFKEVNDSLGHDNGDELLVRLGERLVAAVRPGDVVARLGGDEFGVVLARVTSENDALAALDRLRAAVGRAGAGRRAAARAGGEHRLRAAARRRRHSRRPAAARRHRDVRRQGRATPVSSGTTPRRTTTTPTGSRSSASCDARWPTTSWSCTTSPSCDCPTARWPPSRRWSAGTIPRHGLLYPDAFLPLAEQTGLIDPLTDWVVAAALRADACSGRAPRPG